MSRVTMQRPEAESDLPGTGATSLDLVHYTNNFDAHVRTERFSCVHKMMLKCGSGIKEAKAVC